MHEFILLASLRLVFTPSPIHNHFIRFDTLPLHVGLEVDKIVRKALSIESGENSGINTEFLRRSFILTIPKKDLSCKTIYDRGARAQGASSKRDKLYIHFPPYIQNELAANLSTAAIANPVAFRFSCYPIRDNSLPRSKTIADSFKKVFAVAAIVASFAGILASNRLFR
jgi:hypothetical protein